MTPFRLRYTPAAAESIRHLQPAVKQAVREALRSLAGEPERGHAVVLELAGFRSLRVSRNRVIYRIQDSERVIEIYLVGARKSIYEAFHDLLEQRTAT